MSDPSIKILLIESDAELGRADSRSARPSKRIRLRSNSSRTPCRTAWLASRGAESIRADRRDRIGLRSQLRRRSNPRKRSRCGGGRPVRSVEGSCAPIAVAAAGAQDYLIRDDLKPGILEHAVRYAVGRKRADDELRHSEARYRSLVESLPLNMLPQGPRWATRLRQPELHQRDRPPVGAD